MKWIKEIKAVGLRDWFWFVVILQRDEFHYKLGAAYYSKTPIFSDSYFDMKGLIRAREKAHRIDLILKDL